MDEDGGCKQLLIENMKHIFAIFILTSLPLVAFAVPFEQMKLTQDINTQSLDVVSQNIVKDSNANLIVGGNSESLAGIPPQRLQNLDGIIFDVYEDGEVNFFFNDLPYGTKPLDKILVNGIPLAQSIRETVMDAMKDASVQLGA